MVGSGVGSRVGSTVGLALGAGGVTAGVGPAVEVGTVVGATLSGVGSKVGSWSSEGVNVGTAHASDIAIAKTVNTPVFKSLDSGERLGVGSVWEVRKLVFRFCIQI